MKKSFQRLCSALLFILFNLGCSVSPSSVAVSENYIFLNNLLVGSYKDGQWYNADNNENGDSRDVYFGDLLQQDAYYCYNQTKLLGTSKNLKFNIQRIMWRIRDNGKLLLDYSDYYDWDNSTVTYRLPQQLPDALYRIKCEAEDNKFYFDSSISPFAVSLAITADFNPLPKNEVIKVTGPLSKADTDAVKAELERLGIPDAPVNITEVEACNINADRKNERFIFAQTPFTERGYLYIAKEELENNQSGYYNIILYKSKTGYKPVASWCYPFSGNQDLGSETGTFLYDYVRWSSMIGIYDLNNDGIFELCVNQRGYGVDRNIVYSLNKKGEWEQVLTLSCGINHAADDSSATEPAWETPPTSKPDESKYLNASIEEDPGYFILVDGLLVGSYHDNQWHNLDNREISIADILKQDAYYCYNQTEQIGISKLLTFDEWSVGKEGLTFLIPYAQKLNSNENCITFNLPYELPQNLQSISVETYNSSIDFNFDFSSYSIPLVLSADFNPLPKTEITKSTAASSADKAAVKAELERLGIPGAPVNITECYDFDFNNDGNIERFVLAKTPVDNGHIYVTPEEIKNGKSGYYYMILCKEQSGYKTITSWSRPAQFNEIRFEINESLECLYLIGFFDLNNDGVFEICLDNPGWEGGSVFVCSLNENNDWIQVLTGRGGM